jgi:hypothetical protein
LSADNSAFAKEVALEPEFAMNLKRLGHEAKKVDQIRACSAPLITDPAFGRYASAQAKNLGNTC